MPKVKSLYYLLIFIISLIPSLLSGLGTNMTIDDVMVEFSAVSGTAKIIIRFPIKLNYIRCETQAIYPFTLNTWNFTGL